MDVAITELEKIDATRVDGVDSPANGIPILLMKAVAEPAVKGMRDCPKCDKSYDADHQGSKCENCGADLPDADASKAADDKVNCPTCDGDGKIMGDKRDCPDCDATGKVTPDKAKRLAAKSLAKAVIASLPDGIAKAVGADGQVDEGPDVEMGGKILAMLGQAIAAEAAEMASGAAGEVCDIMELACAAEAVRCWRDGEQAVSLGDVMPASMLMQSAADEEKISALKALKDRIDEAIAAKAGPTAEERRQAASEGNALSDGSYPIRNEHELHAAAILARSGHGDVEGAKRLISRRAKELGVANPLDDDKDDASKAQIAKGDASVDTGAQGSDDLAQVVETAVTKATASLRDELSSVREELAKVKATPVPGGPVQSAAARPQKQGESRDDWAAKAAYYRDMAATVTSDANAAEGYRQLARQASEKAATAS